MVCRTLTCILRLYPIHAPSRASANPARMGAFVERVNRPVRSSPCRSMTQSYLARLSFDNSCPTIRAALGDRHAPEAPRRSNTTSSSSSGWHSRSSAKLFPTSHDMCALGKVLLKPISTGIAVTMSPSELGLIINILLGKMSMETIMDSIKSSLCLCRYSRSDLLIKAFCPTISPASANKATKINPSGSGSSKIREAFSVCPRGLPWRFSNDTLIS